jgi:5-methylcytosine-specific restriction endonuclease McrA
LDGDLQGAPAGVRADGGGGLVTQTLKRDGFYESSEWLDVRYRAMARSNRSCRLCGCHGYPGNPLQVDHIKPRSLFPELELDLHNLQVLCKSCNTGKSNRDSTDWRWKASDELISLMRKKGWIN